MKERPIIFCGSMVRAIVDGRKTMTRRVVKPAPVDIVQLIGKDNNPTGEYGWCSYPSVISKHIRCPYGAPGDHLWVRETFRELGSAQMPDGSLSESLAPGNLIYRADGHEYDGPWRTPIFMPRWASRITLEVTAVRVERVQDISSSDAEAEGILSTFNSAAGHGDFRLGKETSHQAHFRVLWDSINAKRGFRWTVNPWVWVVQFKRLEAEAK